MRAIILLTFLFLLASCDSVRRDPAGNVGVNAVRINSDDRRAGPGSSVRLNANSANVGSVDPPMGRAPGTDPPSRPKSMPTGSVATSPLPPPQARAPRSPEEIEIEKKLKSGYPLNP